MNDPLGDRIKEEFESTTRLLLPRKTHTIIRLDGNAFHTYTRGLPKPFDETLHDDLVSSAAFLCAKISGAQLAYVQSDEVSLLLTDFTNTGTQPWFGSVQKMASVSASMLTAKFNAYRNLGIGDVGEKLAFFDSRVFTIEDPKDVIEYFLWRRVDATRNSISALARAHFSHRQLQGRSAFEMQRMLDSERGILWMNEPPKFRYGTVIHKEQVVEDVTFVRDGEEHVARDVTRHLWTATPATDRDILLHLEPCLLR